MFAKTIRRALLKPASAPPQNLQGRNMVVTGCSPGSLGFASAAILARWGANVLVTTRSGDDRVRAAILEQAGGESRGAQIAISALDLCDANSVDTFAAMAMAHFGGEIDVLLNCAGIHLDLMSKWQTPRLTDDDQEIHWRTNYLGTLQLTHRLLPALQACAAKRGARIVNVVSMLHKRGSNAQLDTGAEPYNSWVAYGLSKLALMHFTFELQRRYGNAGIGAYCLHPGSVNTPVATKGMASSPLMQRVVQLLSPLQSLFMLSPEEGAQTQILCATDPDAAGGHYYRDCKIATPSVDAQDAVVAAALWDKGLAWLETLSQQ